MHYFVFPYLLYNLVSYGTSVSLGRGISELPCLRSFVLSDTHNLQIHHSMLFGTTMVCEPLDTKVLCNSKYILRVLIFMFMFIICIIMFVSYSTFDFKGLLMLLIACILNMFGTTIDNNQSVYFSFVNHNLFTSNCIKQIHK